MIYFLFILINFLPLFSGESGLSIFYHKPYSDILANADMSLVSHTEKNRGSVNSAFLGDIKTHSVSASFWSDYYGSSSYSFISASYKISKNTGAGISYFGYSSGEEEIYLLDRTVDNMVYEKDAVVSFSVGFNLNSKINAGIKIKNISSTLAESYRARSFTSDFDIIFRPLTGVSLYTGVENTFGNLSYNREKESLPLLCKFEIAKTFYFDKLDFKTGFGLKKSKDFVSYSFAISLKSVYIPLIFDTGYLSENGKSFLGFGLSVGIENIYFGYGLRYPEIFGSLMHRFSVTYFFGDYSDKKGIRNIKDKHSKPAIKRESKEKKKYEEPVKNIIIF